MIIGSSSKSFINFRLDMMRAFQNKGLEVYACCGRDNNFEHVKQILDQHHITLIEAPLNNTKINPFSDIKSVFSLYKKIKLIHPDYVFLYNIKPVIYGSFAAKFAGVNTVVSMMSGLGHLYTMESFTIKTLRKITNFLYRIAFSTNRMVIFQNPDDLKLFNNFGLVNHVTTTIVPGSGVNLQQFPETPLPATGPLTFLFVGRLLETKGLKEFCKAASLIRTHYPTAQFQILGGLHTNPSFIDPAQIMNLLEDSGVQYLGELESSLKPIQQCHVVVLPSYREGVPKALLEALSVGRPIITTDVPGCRETVVANQNGLLVPARDAQSLANAMEYLIQNAHHLKEMGKESRKLAEQRFDVNSVNQTIIESLGLKTG
jgi:glycosyltransferase involved in cell wall biosynthesis